MTDPWSCIILILDDHTNREGNEEMTDNMLMYTILTWLSDWYFYVYQIPKAGMNQQISVVSHDRYDLELYLLTFLYLVYYPAILHLIACYIVCCGLFYYSVCKI